MPDLNFVLPHWLYWSVLVVFPLIAMVLARRQLKSGLRPSVSLPIGYLLLISAGFIGIHRFYVKNWRGVLFLPLFFGILLSNGEGRQAREDVSLADSDVAVAEFDVEMAAEDVEADPEDAEAAARLVKATAESGPGPLVLGGTLSGHSHRCVVALRRDPTTAPRAALQRS